MRTKLANAIDAVAPHLLHRWYTYRNTKIHPIEREMPFLRALVDPAMACIDCGAHFGYYSQAMANITTRPIHCIEPHPLLAAQLKRKLSRDRCKVYITSLSDSGYVPSVLCVPVANDLECPGLSYLAAATMAKNYDRSKVRVYQSMTRALDGFVFEHVREPLGFIKIDVEGHELQVLKGGFGLLRYGFDQLIRPNLMIEIEKRHNPRWKKVFNLLVDLKYGCVHLSKTGWVVNNPESGIATQTEVNYKLLLEGKTSAYVSNFIFIPLERYKQTVRDLFEIGG